MSDSSRHLGGKQREAIREWTHISKLHIQTIPTMTAALQLSRRQFFKGVSESDRRTLKMIGERPVDGDKARLALAMDRSEDLVADAIFVDQRLARRAQWQRRDEGEHCDSGLLAAGDDQPFYKYTRQAVNDATMAGEPLRIVISTDDNNVPKDTAAAFIATARLVQQFIPLEIWWQGSWLTQDRTKGFVFHAPLVQGDMDFSRLEFCIADPLRDAFSYLVMATHAILDIGEGWNECGFRAEAQYLLPYPQSNLAKFVSHHGITPDGQSIAWTAARWIGWQAEYMEAYNADERARSAAQSLPEKASTYTPPTAADQERWARQDSERKAKEKAEAQSRLQTV